MYYRSTTSLNLIPLINHWPSRSPSLPSLHVYLSSISYLLCLSSSDSTITMAAPVAGPSQVPQQGQPYNPSSELKRRPDGDDSARRA
jgi:hypothetical protein